MNAPDHAAIAGTPPGLSPDLNLLIGTLRAVGAERFDPVRWHYIEALARRTAAYKASSKRMLEAKLMQALKAFKEGFERARCEANEMLLHAARQFPQAEKELRDLFEAGDFKDLHRSITKLKAGAPDAPLRALLRRLAQQSAHHGDARMEEIAPPRVELKTIRNFRRTWARLSVEKQVAQALEQAPKNAGPINSHMLVLRSLALMSDISPDYLNRFISYADTLLCLEQGGNEKGEKKLDKLKKRQPAKTVKK